MNEEERHEQRLLAARCLGSAPSYMLGNITGKGLSQCVHDILASGDLLAQGRGPARGEYALCCLTPEAAGVGLERGYLTQGRCSTGIVPVGKIIKAVPGDKFQVQGGVLLVNGERFMIHEKDGDGRPLSSAFAEGEHTVAQDRYLLLSDHSSKSWDSRYWGTVPVENLLKPLVVFYGKKT